MTSLKPSPLIFKLIIYMSSLHNNPNAHEFLTSSTSQKKKLKKIFTSMRLSILSMALVAIIAEAIPLDSASLPNLGGRILFSMCDKAGPKAKCYDVPGKCKNCAYKTCGGAGPDFKPIQMICDYSYKDDSCFVQDGRGMCHV